MNTLIIGGNDGFGKEYAVHLKESTNCTVITTGREMDLFGGVWLADLHKLIVSEFESPENVDHVVLAAYDRIRTHENVQLGAALALWPLLKDLGHLTYTLVGDVTHQYDATVSLYASHKRALYNQAMVWARHPHQCHLIMFEPSTMENRAVQGQPYLDWPEAIESLDSAACRSRRTFTQVAVIGSNFLHAFPGPTST
jgi:hypothetical protein